VRLWLLVLLAWLAGPAGAQALVVAVDSSLAAAMPALVRSFEIARPGVSVKLVPGPAAALLAQVARGPGIDLLAGIDGDTASSGLQRHLLKPDLRSAFASNTLVLVVPVSPAGSGVAITRLADLARPEVQFIAIGRQASVPTGRYAREVINSQRLWPSLQRKLVQGDDEAALLGLIVSGDVSAGFVFGSTAAVAGDRLRVVETLTTALPLRHLAHVTANSRQAALAEAFVAHLRSPGARAELQRLGFAPP
jgi:molybdate transport system substrate-binding protein